MTTKFGQSEKLETNGSPVTFASNVLTNMAEPDPNVLAKTPEAVFSLDDAPFLPISPKLAEHLVALLDEHTLPAEKFRMLANRVASVRLTRELKLVHVTSSVLGEGKSLVSANLAVTFARRRPDQKVLLLEGDLRKPSLTRVFGTNLVPGFGEWWESGLREGIPPVYRLEGLHLWLLPAGVTERPTDIMQSPRLPQILADLAKLFDWVVIDSPPLLPVADSGIWARVADGTILVVRAGVPPAKAIRKGLESLDNARLIGVVLNDSADEERSQYYNQYYGMYGRPGSGTSAATKTSLVKS
jgi:capsular exopolysaccharide synthesis family protein